MDEKPCLRLLLLRLIILLSSSVTVYSQQQTRLEEVVVTAERHQRTLQDLPVAISVLNDRQLQMMGIYTMADLKGGAIPSLRVQNSGGINTNLIMSIRGNGPSDISQVTREGSVAIYIDGVYQGRAQGLSAELVDMQRIEVLRGPQGTLFGRNATGGAVNIVSKKPTGEWSMEQTVGVGNYDALRTVTRLNLPKTAGISAKFDYIHDERDGWVDNTDPAEEDYDSYKKDGGRLSLNAALSDSLSLDYRYDQTRDRVTQPYHQLYQSNPLAPNIVVEQGRQSRTRFPVAPLDFTHVEQQAHTLTANWERSDRLSIKSITALQDLEVEGTNNYAGVLGFNGLIFNEDIDHSQFSEEIQLLGSVDNIEWVAGVFYFEEDNDYIQQIFFSLDLSTDPPTRIGPPLAGSAARTEADADSSAVYAQATWAPASKQFQLTAGLRYTVDKKDILRPGSGQRARIDDDHFGGGVTLAYDWQEYLSTYLKWSQSYKAPGVNLRGPNFLPYEDETAKTWEAGLKTELWSRRLRFNAAVFFTDYENLQLDFSNPEAPGTSETINASNTVTVDGLELDISLLPLPGLVLAASYVYLDGDMPLQPNPLDNNALTRFDVVQTPKHAGALSVDYTFPPQSYGTLIAHLDLTSTAPYTYVANELNRRDGYTLVNARLTLGDISLSSGYGAFEVSVWGKNLDNESYIVLAFPTAQFYGEPRTYGLDISYKF